MIRAAVMVVLVTGCGPSDGVPPARDAAVDAPADGVGGAPVVPGNYRCRWLERDGDPFFDRREPGAGADIPTGVYRVTATSRDECSDPLPIAAYTAIVSRRDGKVFVTLPTHNRWAGGLEDVAIDNALTTEREEWYGTCGGGLSVQRLSMSAVTDGAFMVDVVSTWEPNANVCAPVDESLPDAPCCSHHALSFILESVCPYTCRIVREAGDYLRCDCSL